MNLSEIDKEFELLKEYMDIYIQLLPYYEKCGGSRIKIHYMPTFEHFKNTYSDERYSMVIANYKDAKVIYDGNKIGDVYTQGLGSESGIAYRYYSYYKGCQYFTGGNIHGDFIVLTDKINENLKNIK